MSEAPIAEIGRTVSGKSGAPAPLFPETVRPISAMGASDIWSRYVRYIGAGAVAVAGILTVAKNLPTMGKAFAGVVRGLRNAPHPGPLPPAEEGAAGRDRDLPGAFVLGGIVLVV